MYMVYVEGAAIDEGIEVQASALSDVRTMYPSASIYLVSTYSMVLVSGRELGFGFSC